MSTAAHPGDRVRLGELSAGSEFITALRGLVGKVMERYERMGKESVQVDLYPDGVRTLHRDVWVYVTRRTKPRH